jgi:UDP-N-acetylmuramyl pentapeptide synthase
MRLWQTAEGLSLGALAFVWRRLMFRTTFVTITGSLGKTTTTRIAVPILASSFPTNSTRGANNSRISLARTVLRTRPRHRVTVLEVGTKRPGALRRAAWQFRPDVVVILSVARTHTNYYPTLDDTAAEKATLMSRLGKNGIAILNGDDPRVLAMAARAPGRVRTFGRSPQFDMWASDISSRWPERLCFTVHAGGRSLPVRTKLVGGHWVTAALAALSLALCCGLDLAEAVSALEQAETYPGRMQPLPLPSGAVLLRDDFNASVDSLAAGLKVLREAQAHRRILVTGDVEDSGKDASGRFADLGRDAAASADMAIFFGEHGELGACAAVAAGMDPERARSFPTQREAGEFLTEILAKGDLVLLRSCDRDNGAHPICDHPERIYYAQFGTVECQRVDCRDDLTCDTCCYLRPGLQRAAEVPESQRPRWEPLRKGGQEGQN